VSNYPVPDRAAGKELGAALRGAGYSETAVYDLLGEDAYSIDRDEVLVEERRLPDSRVGTLVRLFFLQLPLPADAAVEALGQGGLDALSSTGLAEVGDEVTPRSRVLPIGKLLLASDGYSQDEKDPPDYVATYTPTSRLLDSLTPRPHVKSALDVGTGNGVHALLAAQHAARVVATDVNERALAYTELNAALNGVTNVECRVGSLFEPVSTETFDLITCNAPYVVSPERRWAYRDGGFEADEISKRVVREAAGHLADGGFATLLVSWLATDERRAHERVLEWTEPTGCDSWILPTWESDSLSHAAEWNSHLADDPEALRDALDEWTRYFDDLDVGWVSEGAVLLHRTAQPQQTARIDSLDEEDLDDAGDQIQRAFAARERLSSLGAADGLLDAKLSLAAAIELERELEPKSGRAVDVEGRVELSEGTKHAVDVTADAQEVVAMLDGARALGDVIEGAAARLGLSDEEASALRDETLDVSRELLELGALRFN
jgi:methylase of polypeptide subunit release factors